MTYGQKGDEEGGEDGGVRLLDADRVLAPKTADWRKLLIRKEHDTLLVGE